MSIVGNLYLERGDQVIVLAQWRAPSPDERKVPESERDRLIRWYWNGSRSQHSGPRNVLIARPDGSFVVRPFRGLRKRPQNRVWYCTMCGWATLTLPSGEVRCIKCNGLGLRGSEARPIRITCPFERCEWSGWDDGGINNDLGRHLRTDHFGAERSTVSQGDSDG